MHFNLIRINTLLLIITLSISAQETEQSYLNKADDAFSSFDHQAALINYEAVLSLNPDSYEASWKLARSFVDIGEDFEDEDKRAEYYKSSEQYARQSVKLNPEGSYGHLYLSIALGRVALDAGAKQRIKMSKEIKKEADLAVKLDPENDLAYHVLGRWNRKISNLSWIEKGFADIFLGGVPKNASNEEAIINFNKAIKLKPLYINHYLELGITYEMMDDDKKAIETFKKCLEIQSVNPKDKKRKLIAQEYLDDLM